MYICEFCEKILNGIEQYKAHLNSEKHKKKARNLTSSTPDAVMTAVPKVTTENSKIMYNCEVCDKIFTGIQPFTAHLNSEKHKKKTGTTTSSTPDAVMTTVPNVTNENSQNMKKAGTTTSYAGITDVSNTSNEKLEDCIVPFGTAYKCITCDMPLNSLGQAQTHIYGQKHKKMNSKIPVGSAKSSGPFDMNDLNKTLDENDFGSKTSLINDIKFSDVEMKDVMSDVKIFNVDDPIEF